MHVGQRAKLRLLKLAAALAVCAWGADAAAYHSKEQRLTDHTAYTLPKNALRLGVLKTEYGMWDPLLIGTYTLPWLLRVGNAHAKWRYLSSDPWAAAVQLGAYRLDVSELEALQDEPGDAVITGTSFEPSVSYRFDERFTLSATVPYTIVRGEGKVNTRVFDGALNAAVDNLQLTSTFEWRLSRVTALVLHARYLVFQRAYGDASATYHPDEFTTVRVDVDAESADLDFKAAWSVVPAVALSWQTFNLELGLGYGNWSIAPFNFVLPKKTPIADLDVFWMF